MAELLLEDRLLVLSSVIAGRQKKETRFVFQHLPKARRLWCSWEGRKPGHLLQCGRDKFEAAVSAPRRCLVYGAESPRRPRWSHALVTWDGVELPGKQHPSQAGGTSDISMKIIPRWAAQGQHWHMLGNISAQRGKPTHNVDHQAYYKGSRELTRTYQSYDVMGITGNRLPSQRWAPAVQGRDRGSGRDAVWPEHGRAEPSALHVCQKADPCHAIAMCFLL